MVVISECFPSNHELVNTARESYRASLQLSRLFHAPIHETESTDNELLASCPTLTEDESLDFDAIPGETRNEIKTVMDKYPGGFRDFLKNSKLHLNRSQNIDETIRSVQELVARMNSAASISTATARPAGTFAESSGADEVLDIIRPDQQRQQRNSEYGNLLDAGEQTSRDTGRKKSKQIRKREQSSNKVSTIPTADEINMASARTESRPTKLPGSARGNTRSRKKSGDSNTSASGSISARQQQHKQPIQNKSTSLEKINQKHPPQTNPDKEPMNDVVPNRFSIGGNKTKYNDTAPRYLDVFKKANAPQEVVANMVGFAQNEHSAFAGYYTGLDRGQDNNNAACSGGHGRFNAAPFEHNWTELPMPVVTIEF